MLKILNFINRIKEIFINFLKNKNSLMLTDGIDLMNYYSLIWLEYNLWCKKK